ncbi:UDP-N-acetylmuramoyl-L-alanine--D-glutamateligase (EC 6.3.2.9) [uncultured Gammaproteobacteria bacterium]|nr:UDP-N-acetylmuramoyl-L-alanine--D-glutamateligase (EC 6.3.2.9) [uncultured Gammaproteobacteria bacterium]
MKLILGNGKTAQSIARFLDKKNTPFTLFEDTRKIKDPSVLQGIDEIFISPGIPQTQPIVIWARAQNISITSDIELFSRHAQAPIIGITGSNGKSTVTQLLGEMIANDNKKVAIGGNIGKPALDCLSPNVEFYVLELSSYQLDYTQNLNLFAGVVLNITPDHLDRYPSFEHYVNSKLSLYQHCQTKVINSDEALVSQDPSAKHFGIDMPKQPADFGTVTCHGSCFFLKGDDMLMAVNEMQLIGEHNVTNILAALSLGDQIGLDMTSMIACIKTFKGLEHRLEWVAQKQNIDYYNDSKATNAISTIKAIKALTNKYKTITLILGGIPKDENYSKLFTLINKHITSVILIGQSTNTFKTHLKTTQITQANSMQTAIKFASNTNCEAVLLSPACASFDMFDNFEHRGRVFKEEIKTKY